jgi:hypothetical protein
VEVRAPRFSPCRCGVASRRTLTPVAEIMPDRCTPDYERTLAKMGSMVPYRRARSLLDEFYPLGDTPEVETIRQRTLHVGARLEREAATLPTSAPPAEARSIALAIDGGHVKAVRSHQGRSFEVFVAQVSNDDGEHVAFSSLPAEADRQAQQLRGVLHNLGATSRTPATILSDGADGPRSLGEAASIGPTHHVLDWFHLSMRIQHVAQAVKSWPDATAKDRQEGARLADIVDQHIRWRLWHGQVQRSLNLIGDTLEPLDVMAKGEASTAVPAAKVAGVLRSLETYVSGQSDLIIDYATARRTDIDRDHREHGAVVAASPDGRQPTNALVVERRASDAQSPNLGHEPNLQQGLRRRGAVGTSSVSKCGVITPRFWTVSCVPARPFR